LRARTSSTGAEHSRSMRCVWCVRCPKTRLVGILPDNFCEAPQASARTCVKRTCPTQQEISATRLTSLRKRRPRRCIGFHYCENRTCRPLRGFPPSRPRLWLSRRFADRSSTLPAEMRARNPRSDTISAFSFQLCFLSFQLLAFSFQLSAFPSSVPFFSFQLLAFSFTMTACPKVRHRRIASSASTPA